MNHKFLIYISQRYGYSIARPLQSEINKRGYEVAWFNEIKANDEYIEDDEVLLETIDDVINYNPEIVFVPTDTVPDFIPGIKVQIFHGFPANKRRGTDQFTIRNFFDLYCTQGPTSTKTFKELSKKLNHFEVVETGWSKLDPLFPLEDNKNRKDNKPVVMISSTFTKSYSLALNNEVFEEIKRLSKSGKWYFEVVLHPMLDKGTVEKFKSIQNEYLTYHDTTDLIPLFKKSDVMLCDTSSALIEYLMQIKPVVTFRNNMPLPSYINVLDVSEIESAIEYALTRPEKVISEIEKYAADSHPYTDGKSSKRVVDAALAFLKKDKSHLKPKPLNIIRKYKIRKKLNYWTLKSFNKSF
ncbi:MAG: CDP-glycerol glycerophosphotransferase family protein [Bacteroidota bacterium]